MTTAPLRVVMIGPVPRIYGGISAVTGALLDAGLAERCRLTYLAEGTRQGPLRKLSHAMQALTRLLSALLRRQADVLHLHVGSGSSFYRHMLYTALGKWARVPVILHWHLPGSGDTADAGLSGDRQRRLARWGLHAATRVLVLSPAWANTLTQLAGNPQAAAKMVVLPNPVDCRALYPPADPAQRSTNQTLFLGDFSPRKGVRDLLAAARLVLAAHADAHFVVAGGEPPAEVVALAQPLGAAVKFPGFVRGDAKRHALQQAALLVLPSYAEGMPVAVLEAMAAGLPVVTTPVGGVPDFFTDGVNGLLVPPGDVAALAAALVRLLDDPTQRAAMGHHNRQQALAQFDAPPYVERLLEVYKEISRQVDKWQIASGVT